MNEHVDRFARGDWYLDQPELRERRLAAARLVDDFNRAPLAEPELRTRALQQLCSHVGAGVLVVPFFRCTYGSNTSLGTNAFINANAFFMDDAPITIEDSARLGPNAQLMTALHPIEDHARRREGWEQALPITIGENTWLGASVTVGPGVTIGRNSVIGAGSTVLTSIPDHVFAAGSPARVIRELPREEDAPSE